MKNITINIPSSSIDQNLYQYDGLYRENQLISKELDKDIQQSITFENDTPVNFKVKTTPYLSYNSFLPETESNLYSAQQLKVINTSTLEQIFPYPKNDKIFVIKKVTSPEIIISTFGIKGNESSSDRFDLYFNISTETLGYSKITRNYNPSILSIIGLKNSYGINGITPSPLCPLFFATTSGGITTPEYVKIDFSYQCYTVSSNTSIKYIAKDNTKLDGTYENIALIPPNDQILNPSIKLVQVPLLLTEFNFTSGFNADNSQPILYVFNYPVYDHHDNIIYKTGFGLENGKKCVGYYPITLENNAMKIAFFDKTYNTKTDKSASFYDIDLDKSTFGIQMPTESKTLTVTQSTQVTNNATTYDLPFDNVTGAMLKKWPSEKHGKPSYVIFQPNIKFKPKTATVNLKLEFNCADKSLNVDDLKNALSLIMEDGEWKTTQTSREYTGNIADVIPD